MEVFMVSVLVCDDHQLVRDALTTIFEHDGEFEVEGSVADFGSAVSILSSKDVQVAVVDVRLGDENGLDVVHWIRDHRPDTKIVLLTNFSSDELVLEASSLGVSAVLDKAVRPNELARVVREVAANRWSGMIDAVRESQGRLQQKGILQMQKLGQVDREIMSLIGKGMTDRDIATRVFLSPQTVRNRVSRLLTTLGRENRTQLALMVNDYDDVGHRFTK
jgi:two-component system response regulator DevR